MTRLLLLPCVLLLAPIGGSTALWTAVAAAGPDRQARPLALVGADTLTTEDLDAEISAILSAARGKGLPSFDPDAVLKRLIQNRLLEQEGYRVGADRTKVVRNQVREFVRLKSLRALLDSISTPGPGAASESPDSLLGLAGMLRRYSHILVPDERLAAALRDSLSRGLPFADLAMRHSTDGAAAKGGDLGWAAEGAYVDAFEEAAARLSLDEIAGPVRTQFGWHLILLTGIKADTLKSRAMAEALVRARDAERRDAAVDRYVDSLWTGLGVIVNDSLLASLDYQSEDPAVQKELETSSAVLATLPTGNLTVRGLTRNIRFQYFHGVAGRPEAPQIRDRMFREWVIEGLLSYQARKLGLDQDPVLLEQANREERRLIREEVLGSILGTPPPPSEPEVQAYYEVHREEFIPRPQVKVQSVLARTQEAAVRLRDGVEAGAQLKWLVSRAPGDVDSLPPYPSDWLDPERMGWGAESLVEGGAIGPTERPGGWAVAQIVAIKRSGPPPLDACREDVLRAMKSARLQQAIQDAFARLEAATAVRILDGARQITADRLSRLRAHDSEGGKP